MAKEETVKSLQEAIAEAIRFKEKEMVSRPEWGTINFQKAEAVFERIYNIIDPLTTLPLEYLPEDIANTTRNHIRNIIGILNKIDAFISLPVFVLPSNIL